MEACKQLAPPGQEAAAAELWLRCVPLEGEVRDFFRPSVEAVHRAVAGMPCVLVEGGAWVQPCEALLASNAAMRELVQAEGILQEQGLRVVHPDLYAFAPALKVRTQTFYPPLPPPRDLWVSVCGAEKPTRQPYMSGC